MRYFVPLPPISPSPDRRQQALLGHHQIIYLANPIFHLEFPERYLFVSWVEVQELERVWDQLLPKDKHLPWEYHRLTPQGWAQWRGHLANLLLPSSVGGPVTGVMQCDRNRCRRERQELQLLVL